MSTCKSPRVYHRGRGGSALLLVIWAIIMISAALVVWINWAQGDMERAANANREVEARAMAHSGVAIALTPQVTDKTPMIEESLNGDVMGYRVRIVGEGGKLNINWLISGEQQSQQGQPGQQSQQSQSSQRTEILKLWLEQHGLTFEEREKFVDCLLDYVDADNLARLNGAEDEPGYTPTNAGRLQSVDEIEKVKNAGPLLRSPGWKDELTIYSQGPIDLNYADESVLRLIPGLGDAQIKLLLQVRLGRDGIAGTEDDKKFTKLSELGSFIGLNQNQLKQLQPFVTLSDTTQRILSEGHSANVVRQIEVVVQKSGANPIIRYWKE